MPRQLRLPVTAHIITGALGSGKTSLILHLLSIKPEGEVWAVLVNEMGAVGIDQAVLASAPGGTTVRELAGGCLCCALSSVTSVAIAQLLRNTKPDRLVIEPSGLAHPAALKAMLTGGSLASAIALQPIVCLVDLAHFKQGAPSLHHASKDGDDTFMGQVRVADILLGTKADLASQRETAAFELWAAALEPPKTVLTCARSEVALEDLCMTNDARDKEESGASNASFLAPRVRGEVWFSKESDRPRPQRMAPVRLERVGDSFGIADTCGWIFHPEDTFARAHLKRFVHEVAAAACLLRFKAVCRVENDTWLHFSAQGSADRDGVGPCAVSVTPLPRLLDSRVELIVTGNVGAVSGPGVGEQMSSTESALLACDWKSIETSLVNLIVTRIE